MFTDLINAVIVALLSQVINDSFLRHISCAVMKNLVHTIDVAIIGGGITGILSAYLLHKTGKGITILEKNKVNSGATKDTTAFITGVIDTSLRDLIKIFGLAKAKRVMESHEQAIALIEKIIRKEQIDCGFKRCSNYEYANSKKELRELEEESAAAKKLGLKVSFEKKENPRLGFRHAGYLEFKRQAKFRAGDFVESLASILKERGIKIIEKKEATSVSLDKNQVTIMGRDLTVSAQWVIIATHEPFNKPLGLYFKKAFYTTYVIEAALPRGVVPEAIYEDVENPYHYFRIDHKDKNTDTLMLGGEDHRSDIPVKAAKNFNSLKKYLCGLLPDTPYTLISKWQGPILESVDGLPYIGPIGVKRILYAMAFSGNGMTYSAIAALIFRDHILKKKNAWANVYRANRIPSIRALILKGRDYTGELIHGALKNTFIK